MAYSWFLFFTYHNDARSSKLQNLSMSYATVPSLYCQTFNLVIGLFVETFKILVTFLVILFFLLILYNFKVVNVFQYSFLRL